MAQSQSVKDSTTIEVMLTPQQMGELANGSNVAPQHGNKRTSLGVVGAAVASVLVVSASVAHLAAGHRTASPVGVQVSLQRPPAPRDQPPAPIVQEPMIFKNPFDQNEVFEFPPGTSEAQARDEVAKVLLERAQGRGPEVLKLRYKKTHAPMKARLPLP